MTEAPTAPRFDYNWWRLRRVEVVSNVKTFAAKRDDKKKHVEFTTSSSPGFPVEYVGEFLSQFRVAVIIISQENGCVQTKWCKTWRRKVFSGGILFNSPALHSLKREQLVKLCKIHSIKASGKNVELIQKLRQHAQTLPKDSPLSIAARSEEHGPIPAQALSEREEQEREIEDDAASYQSSRPPRPSEQWEMVMDSIIEEAEEELSQGTLSSQRTLNYNGSAGEFGTGSSKCLKRTQTGSKSTFSSTSSKGSSVFPPPPSIQELAADELAQMSTPYSCLPEPTYLPQTDHFTCSMQAIGSPSAAIPPIWTPKSCQATLSAQASPHRPMPASVWDWVWVQPRLPLRVNLSPRQLLDSLGTPFRPTTTLQLWYPPAETFKTTFEITFGTPGPNEGIYPTLTFDDLPPTVEVKSTGTPARPPTTASGSGAASYAGEDVAMPGSLIPTSTLATPSKSKSTSNPPSPFVFGTPQHKVTDNQFRAAAAAVLEEMNSKLREDGVDEITTDIISKLHPDAAKNKALSSPRQIKPLPGSKRGEISEKFEKMHQEEFRKMEGIDEVVRKRAERSSPVKKAPRMTRGEEEEKVVVGKKRKSSVLARDEGPKRPSVLAGRASNTRVISAGRRAKANVLPGAFDFDDDVDDDDDPDSSEAEAEMRGGKRPKMDLEFVPPTAAEEPEEIQKKRVQLEKEKEAIRKKLDANRARRRSSALHGQGHGVLAPRKSAAGRPSVGRPRHSVLIKPKPKPSKFGFLSSAKSLVQSVWNRGKPAAAPAAPASNIPKVVPSKPDPAKEKGKANFSKMAAPSLMAAKKSSVAPAKSTAATAATSGKAASGSKTGGLGASSSSSITMSSARSRSPLPSFNGNGTLQSNSSSFATGTKTSSRMSSIAGTGRSRTSSAINAQSGVSSIGTRLSRTSAFTTSSNVSGVGSMGVKSGGGGESRTGMTGTRSSSRFSSTASRLLAPTASSLAKMAARAGGGGDHHTANSNSNSNSGANINAAKRALSPITNSPAVYSSLANARRINSPAPSATFSPKQIFSKPLTLGSTSPSGIPVPTPLKRRGHIRGGSQSSTASNGSAGMQREPRRRRSKVIAKLASQRERGTANSNRVASGSSLASNVSAGTTATTSTATSTIAPKAGRAFASGGGKTRSSLGAKVARPHARASYAGSDKRLGVSVLMSAKKRARRSEYARRKSQRASSAAGKASLGSGEDRMDVE
ncbi:hypothetical protein CPB84DRAFT_1743704 [Gymnopilus junonius]|uniref:SAP domain-containing protein n=1 Tax=Gymnopilus junonius TaxID=109634 RepID=A0A9P5TSU9_GYMJU|nr:hypothetical protein CPB84DRAFT_1743704 [Gymnopilus junonius]